MAGYQLNYDALNELADEFKAMDDELKSSIKDIAKEIGNELKSNTEIFIPREAVAKHGVHLADDVKLSVTSNDKKTTITVKGGKQTGGYWFIVDNGHVAQNGKFVGGVHFTDKAYENTSVLEKMDAFIQRLLG